MKWLDASNSQIGIQTIKTYQASTRGWEEAVASLVAPVGTTGAQVQMVVSSLNATIYVDDFMFTATGGPPPTFDFSPSNGGDRSVTQGSSVTNTITATLVSGSSQPVTFSASGLPTGASASFSAPSCTPTCSTTLTLTTSASTPTGPATITVTGSGGGVTHTTSFTLTVKALPPPPSNLLLNPGFELDANGDGKPDSWSTSSKFTRSSEVVHSGSYAGQFLVTDNSSSTVDQTVNNLTAGTTYSFSGWVNIPLPSVYPRSR